MHKNSMSVKSYLLRYMKTSLNVPTLLWSVICFADNGAPRHRCSRSLAKIDYEINHIWKFFDDTQILVIHALMLKPA